MILRRFIKCHSCENWSIFRIGVDKSKKTDFLVPCPFCKIKLEFTLIQNLEDKSLKIISEDFNDSDCLLNNLEGIKSKVLTIYSEIPIDLKSKKKDNMPFLDLMSFIGSENHQKLNEITSFYHIFHENILNDHKKLISLSKTYDWKSMRKFLSTFFKNGQIKNYNHVKTIHFYYHTFHATFVPLIDLNQMTIIMDEYFYHLNNCFDNKTQKYKQLLEEFVKEHNFNLFKHKILDLYVRVFDDIHSYFPGQIYEFMNEDTKRRISDFRLYRNDFDLIKSQYVDIFEMSSKLLFYLGSILNISVRNEPTLYSNLKKISPKKFKKDRTFNKLFVLNELPELKKILLKLDRPLRNSLGHFNASYDYLDGNLIYEDGKKENYILFLNDMLNAIKVIWYMMKIIEKVEIDLIRLGIKY